MTPEQRRAALDRLDYPYARRDEPKGPWVLHDASGESWAIATDGFVMVAVKSRTVSGALPVCPEAVAKVSSHCFADAEFSTFKREELAAFAGFASRESCQACDGSGKVDCEECDGTWELDCHCYECGDSHARECKDCRGRCTVKCSACGGINKKSYAIMLGAPLDRMKLADLLMASSDSASDIGVAVIAVRTGSMFVLRASDETFRGLLMSLRDVKPDVVFEQPGTWRKQLTTAEVEA